MEFVDPPETREKKWLTHFWPIFPIFGLFFLILAPPETRGKNGKNALFFRWGQNPFVGIFFPFRAGGPIVWGLCRAIGIATLETRLPPHLKFFPRQKASKGRVFNEAFARRMLAELFSQQSPVRVYLRQFSSQPPDWKSSWRDFSEVRGFGWAFSGRGPKLLRSSPWCGNFHTETFRSKVLRSLLRNPPNF